MNRGGIIFWLALITAGASFVGWTYFERNSAERQISAQASLAHDEAPRIQEQLILFTERIVPPRLPFSALLQAMGIDSFVAARITAAAQPVFNLRFIRKARFICVRHPPEIKRDAPAGVRAH